MSRDDSVVIGEFVISMYDLIGDIHGHSIALEEWLVYFGYERLGKGYKHPERTLIFLGDLIDRGPDIRRVIEIARSMVYSGAAVAIIGNHEFNAICYHTQNPQTGEPYRAHNADNTRQHEKTLAAFPSYSEMQELIAWFQNLPLWFEIRQFRAVHACWHADSIQRLRTVSPDATLSCELLAECAHSEALYFNNLENILKGLEVRLPGDLSFFDSQGKVRRDVRVNWCLPSAGKTYRDYSFPLQLSAPEVPLEGISYSGYPESAPPVFFGHYWLQDEEPRPIRDNCFCLDYSVAKQGFLCGYRLGEGFLVYPRSS